MSNFIVADAVTPALKITKLDNNFTSVILINTQTIGDSLVLMA